MKYYLVYKAEYNGKVYIGYTNSRKGFKRRKYEHYLNAENGIDTKFYNALRKYKDLFNWSIIIDNIQTKAEAKKLEIQLISEHDSFVNGYNSTLGGDGGMYWDNKGKNHPMYIQIEQHIIEDIINSYTNGENSGSIAKRHNLYINKVKNVLKENNITLRKGANIINPRHSKPDSIRKLRNLRTDKRKDNYDKSGKNNPRFVETSLELELEVKHLYETGTLNKKEIMNTYNIGKRVIERIFTKHNIQKYYKNEK